jgi:hypothetical protein
METAICSWREEVVVPLRQIRRTMKTGARIGREADAEALRNSVKAIELKAERIELAELAVVLQSLTPSSGAAGEDDFTETIAKVVAFYGQGRQRRSDHLMEHAARLARAASPPDPAN